MQQKLQTRWLIIVILIMNLFPANAQQIVEGLHFATGKPVQVKIENGKIAAVKSIKKLKNGNSKVYIAPGFFDNQVNGFAGVSFSFGESDLTAEGIEKATRELWKFGVTTYLPTLTTNSQDVLVRNFALLSKAVEDKKLLGPFPDFTSKGRISIPKMATVGLTRNRLCVCPIGTNLWKCTGLRAKKFYR
jgi:N-acetylglucosamine-6-phosphate deacetylase